MRLGIAGIPKLLHKLAGVINLSQGELLFIDILHTFRFEDKYTVSSPSLSKISTLTGISKQSLKNWKSSLQEKKLIIVRRRFKGKRQTSNLYDFSPLYRILFEFLVLIDAGYYPDIKAQEGLDFHVQVVKEEKYREALRKVLFSRAGLLKEEDINGSLDLLRAYQKEHKALKEEEERAWA